MEYPVIPKIIHYCWFGHKDKPELVKRCINSWKIMEDYQVIEWNENTFDVRSHSFTMKMYELGIYAYVADYVRLKVLCDFGGIYLDADVEVKKKFPNNILCHKTFVTFSFDCALSTAIIGSVPSNEVIIDLLKKYNDENLDYYVNNYMITKYFVENFSGFKLNNRFQEVGDCIGIYPKECFECPTEDLNMGYSVHHALQSWTNKQYFKNNLINDFFFITIRLIISLAKWLLTDPVYSKYRRAYAMRKTQYYQLYLEQKRIKKPD